MKRMSFKEAVKLVEKHPIFHLSREELTTKKFKKVKKERRKYGFSYEECWNLDETLAKLILPRLVRFRDSTNCYPNGFKDLEDWKNTIDKMIESFAIIVEKNSWMLKGDEQKKVQEGLALFGRWYLSLWD